jgi:hypothetical protein
LSAPLKAAGRGRCATPVTVVSSERVTNTNYRSDVVVVEIGNAGAVRNGDFQTAGDLGIRNAGINVETFGKVIIRIGRILAERARAGSPPSGVGTARPAEDGSRSASHDSRKR